MLLRKPSVLAVCLSVGGDSSCEKGQGLSLSASPPGSRSWKLLTFSRENSWRKVCTTACSSVVGACAQQIPMERNNSSWGLLMLAEADARCSCSSVAKPERQTIQSSPGVPGRMLAKALIFKTFVLFCSPYSFRNWTIALIRMRTKKEVIEMLKGCKD